VPVKLYLRDRSDREERPALGEAKDDGGEAPAPSPPSRKSPQGKAKRKKGQREAELWQDL
jgi:hypothetical protein